jgi:hypothetical protein
MEAEVLVTEVTNIELRVSSTILTFQFNLVTLRFHLVENAAEVNIPQATV